MLVLHARDVGIVLIKAQLKLIYSRAHKVIDLLACCKYPIEVWILLWHNTIGPKEIVIGQCDAEKKWPTFYV